MDAADGAEGPALASDESGVADLLPGGDCGELVTIRLYASAARARA